MKKLILLIMAAVMGVAAAQASDTYSHDVSTLPQAARNTIERNFKAKFNFVKIDKDFGRISEYEVVLTDGTEITFDRNGNWKEVETGVNSAVPKSMIPEAITSYVKETHKKAKIVGIEKKSRGEYEVTLDNDIDLRFDSQGRFLRYD